MNFVLSRQDKLPIGRNLDPDIIDGMNVMEVSLNNDCSHARLKICITGDSFQQRQGFSWLSKNNKLLRYRLAQILRHRKNVPTLSFESHNLIQQAEVLMKMNEHLMNRRRRLGLPDEDEPQNDIKETIDEHPKGQFLI
ncbi:Ribosome-binding factor A family protein [Babesia bovis T2Bo]|uniref:Ribosome-binding factor A family protein n=1 Tax=Babesia bovis T2Bo TaxID=484906 RepID=UPI001C35725F|nr:Ribosome-binding factor A family protein [Babesia bovis T2Bo]EDO06354.2 Ribosome-binding factor A family protein [Babesia bovis T2Bo]